MRPSPLKDENISFSKLLGSKDIADIIKAVVKESCHNVHPLCNERKESQNST
jgi:hypothetical protein